VNVTAAGAAASLGSRKASVGRRRANSTSATSPRNAAAAPYEGAAQRLGLVIRQRRYVHRRFCDGEGLSYDRANCPASALRRLEIR
jgi:hypothetical protein